MFDSFYLAIISERNTFSKGFKKLTSLKQLSALEGDFPTAEDQQNMSGFSEIVPFDRSFQLQLGPRVRSCAPTDRRRFNIHGSFTDPVD